MQLFAPTATAPHAINFLNTNSQKQSVAKSRKRALVLWFDETGIDDVPLVGGKNASLGEMHRELTKKGVRIPDGFATTAFAYRKFMEEAGIKKEVRKILKGLDVRNYGQLSDAGSRIRRLIINSKFPEKMGSEILRHYAILGRKYGMKDADVAVRSSATAEDLPNASFAGQQESYLNVRGEKSLLESCKKCIASLFTNRAIAYRQERGFNHFKVALSIGIQKMVRSDRAGSGVMFTIDTESGFNKVILIDAGFGLGENIVKGRINPDEYYVFKETLDLKYNSIISKKVGSKTMKMVYSGNKTRNVSTSESERRKFVLNDHEIMLLARWGKMIEDHYSAKHRRYMPMDVEWAKDGISGKLFIVQARPETVQSRKDVTKLERYVLKEKGHALVTGSSVGSKISSGKVHIIESVKHIKEFKPGEVLVTQMTDPDWVPVMKMASAIVTNRGGKSCHAAIVSRELGVTCVVGTNNATKVLKNGEDVTVSCAEGEQGYVYDGKLRFEIKSFNLKQLPKTRTKIMVNIGSPSEAFSESALPVSGVGLAREEFIINSYIGVHPLALIKFNTLKDKKAKKKIAELTYNYKDKKEYFVQKLAEGVATISAAFYPREVIVRLSDFKSNEYANLIGGKEFEPEEDNPMLGWRGASRYYDDKYEEAFSLECKALLKVREEMGLNNVKIMIPMCRSVEEGKKVIAEMKKNGLVQGKNGLELYVMCEIPANVVLAEKFAKIFDGFSIGSNDLTQMTLGVDRDSELVAHIFDERDDAVKWMAAHVIKAAKKAKRKIGICGEAPSTYPEFAEFLVECGIDSISLAPDAVVKTLLVVAKKEKKR
ncbi:phosphoenolpyruvate synthase [Candidatus Woesearchaeota archaeon]|nr:phosphoenolpyruvate synthase [Candidatus Woesearchaeota archaeon]